MAHRMEGHTVRRYDGELNSLHLKTLEMATLVRGQLRDVIAALLERAPAKAASVEERDSEVDRLQVRLDEEVASVIARRGPMALDLRTILAISKAVTDLERIGDHARNIAAYVVFMVTGKDVRHRGGREPAAESGGTA